MILIIYSNEENYPGAFVRWVTPWEQGERENEGLQVSNHAQLRGHFFEFGALHQADWWDCSEWWLNPTVSLLDWSRGGHHPSRSWLLNDPYVSLVPLLWKVMDALKWVLFPNCISHALTRTYSYKALMVVMSHLLSRMFLQARSSSAGRDCSRPWYKALDNEAFCRFTYLWLQLHAWGWILWCAEGCMPSIHHLTRGQADDSDTRRAAPKYHEISP